jgi:hypothetical protein
MGNRQSAPQESPPPHSGVSERVPQPTRWVELEELVVPRGANDNLVKALIEMTVCRNIFDSWADKVNEYADDSLTWYTGSTDHISVCIDLLLEIHQN